MKIPIAIASMLLSLYSCSNKEKKVDKDTAKSPGKKEIFTLSQERTDNIDTLYISDGVRIYAHPSLEKKKIAYTSIKFEPYLSFDDFKVKRINHRKRVKLDLNSYNGAMLFKTRLRKAFNSSTANFAGHYNFVYWGCGSPCQMSMVIDRGTGRIYPAPDATLGYDFNPHSRMLIVNPPYDDGFYDDYLYGKPEIYVFDEQTKKFNKLRPR